MNCLALPRHVFSPLIIIKRGRYICCVCTDFMILQGSVCLSTGRTVQGCTCAELQMLPHSFIPWQKSSELQEEEREGEEEKMILQMAARQKSLVTMTLYDNCLSYKTPR